MSTAPASTPATTPDSAPSPLTVSLAERSYPIHIGSGLLGRASLYEPHLAGRQVLIVTDETVAGLHLDTVTAALAGRDIVPVVLAVGEEGKTMEPVLHIVDTLLEHGFHRSATIVALGGGVVGDIAGFAAAIYQRGIAFIQAPTTLLAQVDSSVGGKTGVNHPSGKNLIGAFHQPACVIADTDALSTLGGRELRAGLAEVIKYGVLWDGEFFAWLETDLDALLACDPDALARAVRRSCEIKAEIVARDERETGGVRALLNLGHTFGHAIEAGTGFGRWLHGEAVAAGMCMAADLARRMDWLPAPDAERIAALVRRAGLPDRGPESLAPDEFLRLMGRDKKAVDAGIRLVLPRAIGVTEFTGDFDPDALDETLAQCRGPTAGDNRAPATE